MNLIFRLFFLLIISRFRKKLHPLSESIVPMTVLPNDLDLNFHMNNGRYLSIMDLGRLDLLMRTDLLGALIKHRWQPLVGGVSMRYRQSLLPLQRYRLHTKVIGWDDKWFYMEQRFTRRNRLIAVGLVKGLFRGKGRNLSPDEVLTLINVNIEAPQIPDRVLTWMSMDPK